MHAQKANYQCIFSFVKIMLQYSCKKRACFVPVFWPNQRHVCLSACLSVNLPVCLSVWLYVYSHSYSVNISDFFLSMSSPSPVWALLGIVGHTVLSGVQYSTCTVHCVPFSSWLVIGRWAPDSGPMRIGGWNPCLPSHCPRSHWTVLFLMQKRQNLQWKSVSKKFSIVSPLWKRRAWSLFFLTREETNLVLH